MAKITIAGDAVVVTSEFRLDDIRKVAKYRPDALVLRGGEDGKEPIFRVGVSTSGKLGKYGVEFCSETHDDRKLATITLAVDVKPDGDIKEYVAELVGTSILNLNKIEESLSQVLEEIEAEKEKVLGNIEVVS